MHNFLDKEKKLLFETCKILYIIWKYNIVWDNLWDIIKIIQEKKQTQKHP